MASRKPEIETDPVAFWRAQHEQAVADVKMARRKAPSVLPKMVQLERDAWREYVAAMDASTTPTEAPSETPTPGTLEAELAQVARLRQAAERKGSLTIAGNLLRQEREVLAKLRERDKDGNDDGLDAASDEDVLAHIESAILALPDPLVVRIRACVEDRLNGKKLRVVGTP